VLLEASAIGFRQSCCCTQLGKGCWFACQNSRFMAAKVRFLLSLS